MFGKIFKAIASVAIIKWAAKKFGGDMNHNGFFDQANAKKPKRKTRKAAK